MNDYQPRNFALPVDYCFAGEPANAVDPYLFSREAVAAALPVLENFSAKSQGVPWA